MSSESFPEEGVRERALSVVDSVYQWSLHRYFLVGSCSLYWIWYDKCKHGFISHIYQTDKYGVVINYALVSLIEILNLVLNNHTYHIIWSDLRKLAKIKQRALKSEWKEHTENRLERWWEKVPNTELSEYQEGIRDVNSVLLSQEEERYRTYVQRKIVLSVLKIIAFNMIFKNNTSTEKAHQRIHVGSVVCLGLLSGASVCLDYWQFPNEWKSIALQSGVGIVCGLLYNVVGAISSGYSERLEETRRTATISRTQQDHEAQRNPEWDTEEEDRDPDPDPVPFRHRIISLLLNGTTMLLGSIAISQTIS